MKKFFLIILAATFLLSACDETFNLGVNIIPDNDLLDMQITDTVEIFMYTELAPEVITSSPEYLLIGAYQDPVFGHTKAGFATQVLQGTYPNFDETDTVYLDSICLVLPLPIDDDFLYPMSSNSGLSLSVYKVTTDLSSSSLYYSDEDLSEYTSNYSELLGEGFAHKEIIYDMDDSGEIIDTLLGLVLRLDDDLGQTFIDEVDSYFWSSGKFTDIFQGIYVETSTENSGIFKVSNTTLSTSQSFGFVLYYHHEGETETKQFGLPINTNAAQFNVFEHDYSDANFYDQIENPGSITDSVAYLQSMGGTVVRLEMPGIKNYENIVVNKAELIIKNAYDESNADFSPIEEMWYAGYDTANSVVYFDDFLNEEYQGAEIDDNDEYHFFLTRIIQNMIEGDFDDSPFNIYLTNLNSGREFSRSIITTGQHSNPAKLVLTYTKY